MTISGAVRFTRLPDGRVDVDLPRVSITVNVPNDSGGVQEAFGISGAARFTMGGATGFQLSDLRVTGYSIFGVGATIPTPASALRPPTADLAGPVFGSFVNLDNFDAIDITFNDVNRLGLNDNSILDTEAEFAIFGTQLVNGSPRPVSISVDNTSVTKVTTVNNDRTFRYKLTAEAKTALATALSAGGNVAIEINFLPNTFSDSRGANNASELERFTVFKNVKPAVDAPYAIITTPFNGQTVSKTSLNAKRYIDVTIVSPTGALADAATFDGHEIKLTGAGAANIAVNTDGTALSTVQRLSATTYRFLLTPKPNIAVSETFVDGEVTIEFVANSWKVGTGAAAINNAGSKEVFTVSSQVQDAAAATNGINVGPLSLSTPSVSLAKMGFKDGKLVLSLAIGVDNASLRFGGSQAAGPTAGQTAAQSNSGISVVLTGLLGTFDISVDLMAITGGDVSSAFDVPGKFAIDIATLVATIPDVVTITGSGIRITYDPNYNPAKNNNLPQELLSLQSATVTFERFGLRGQITPNNGKPGLVIYDNGFSIGEALLIYGGTTTPPPADAAAGRQHAGDPDQRRFWPDPIRLDSRIHRSAHRRGEFQRHLRQQHDFQRHDFHRFGRRQVPARQTDLGDDHRPHLCRAGHRHRHSRYRSAARRRSNSKTAGSRRLSSTSTRS